MFRMTEFLADAGERITILKVVCRRVINRYCGGSFADASTVKIITKPFLQAIFVSLGLENYCCI